MKFHYTETLTPIFLVKLPQSHIQETWGFWYALFILISLKIDIARSVKGPELQGPNAEDAMTKTYVVPENFGDLIKADHKVLSESRNNHRYAVVVQDLATQWIRPYPYKTKKLHKKTHRSCQKVLGAR